MKSFKAPSKQCNPYKTARPQLLQKTLTTQDPSFLCLCQPKCHMARFTLCLALLLLRPAALQLSGTMMLSCCLLFCSTSGVSCCEISLVAMLFPSLHAFFNQHAMSCHQHEQGGGEPGHLCHMMISL